MAFERSGLTQREFCQGRCIALATFKHHRYLERKTSAPSSPAGFSRLSFPPPVPSAVAVELHLPGGLFLRFAGDPAPGYLRELIAGLRP